MDKEVARFLRLKYAVQAAVQVGDSTMAGEALGHTYDQLRHEVRSAIPNELHDEYDRLFPSMNQSAIPRIDLIAQELAGSTAKTRLTTLAGWLEGHIEAEKAAH